MLAHSNHDLVVALHSVCHEGTNPIAWFMLEDIGLSVAILKEVSAKPEWGGPKPKFQHAPPWPCPLRDVYRETQQKAAA